MDRSTVPTDMKFGVSQNIAFPTVYKKQKNLYTEEWKKSLLNVSLKEYELKKAVSLTFYNILYWKEKEKLLNETLKLYTDFLIKQAFV
jgi:cobalt-zinc-cadmium resistance protein CzcA